MANNKLKKISITNFDKVMKSDFLSKEPITTFDWHGLSISVMNTISFNNMLGFVQSASEFCFADETGEYIPQVKDFAIKCNILEYYTNITLPSSLDHRYDMIYKTDIVDCVTAYINNVQLKEITNAINEKVSQVASMGIANIHNEVLKLLSSFEKFQDNIESSLGEVTPDVINEFMNIMRGSEQNNSKNE